MGSDLEVQSQVDVGSIFWFDLDLPLSLEWSDAAKMTDAGKITGYAGDRKTLLVADDKWENRSVLKSLLEPLGFTLIEAEDGQDAWEKAAAQPPHLFILDLDMPILDGLALMERLRQSRQFQHAPIVVSSASVFDADQLRCIEAGADSFLPKPVDAVQLLDQLEKYLSLTWLIDQDNAGALIPPANAMPATAEGPETLTLPSAEVLKALHDLALCGNLRAIVQRVKTLAETEPALQPFADQVQALAQKFQERELITLFASYIERADQ